MEVLSGQRAAFWILFKSSKHMHKFEFQLSNSRNQAEMCEWSRSNRFNIWTLFILYLLRLNCVCTWDYCISKNVKETYKLILSVSQTLSERPPIIAVTEKHVWVHLSELDKVLNIMPRGAFTDTRSGQFLSLLTAAAAAPKEKNRSGLDEKIPEWRP